MHYLYIDESGDLGFSENSSQFFILLGLLATDKSAKKLTFAVKKTLKRKLNLRRTQVHELKIRNIYHLSSQESPNLQMTDMFAWGVFRFYEFKDDRWFRLYKNKIFKLIYLKGHV